MPERLIGELDVEVAKEKIVGNWLRRNDGLNAALRRFFTAGGLGVVDPSISHVALDGKRRHMTTHLDFDLVGVMNQQILEQRELGWWWSPWEVVALAVQSFLDSGAFQANPEQKFLPR